MYIASVVYSISFFFWIMYAIPENDFDEGINYAIQQAENRKIWDSTTDAKNSHVYSDERRLERE